MSHERLLQKIERWWEEDEQPGVPPGRWFRKEKAG
jgi:hypothetical protein